MVMAMAPSVAMVPPPPPHPRSLSPLPTSAISSSSSLSSRPSPSPSFSFPMRLNATASSLCASAASISPYLGSNGKAFSLLQRGIFPGSVFWMHLYRARAGKRKQRQFSVKAASIEAQTLPLGARAPEFELPEPLTGKTWKLEDVEEHPALLVIFICNHCPFVIHLKSDIARLSTMYMQKGLAVIAISSNSVTTHPQDGPHKMAEDARAYNYPFPYLYDATQDVARAFGARCTPDFFLFKKSGRRPFELVYHGRFDDSRPGNNRPITGLDLRQALDCVLSGRPVSTFQRPSMGCSIKWHPQ